MRLKMEIVDTLLPLCLGNCEVAKYKELDIGER